MRTRNADTPKSGPGRKAAQAKKDAGAAEKTPESSPKSAPKSTPKSSGTKVARGKKSTPKAAALATDVITPDRKQEVEAKEMETAVEEPEKSSPEKKGEAPKESAPQAKVVEINEEVKEDQLQSGATYISRDEQVKPDDNLDGNTAAGAAEDVGKASVIEGHATKLNVGGKLVPEPEVEIKQESDPNEKDASETNLGANNEINDESNDETETHLDAMDETGIIQDVKDELDGKIEEDASEDQQIDEVSEQDGFNEAGDEECAAAEVGEGEGDCVEGPGDEEEGPKLEEEEQIQISDMAKERKIKKEQEIFVGGLDRDAVEDDLKKAFENVGEVIEVRLHKDYATNKNKGFAFVKFASKEEAARALEEMKNPLIRGKRCGIAPCEDNDTLFLGNICNTWTKDAIKRKLKDYGIDTVESITLVADTQNEGLSRGFAFLEFACHADAMAAYKRLQKPDVIFGHPERTAKVAFAEPLREPNPEVMAQVKSVFVDGLPPYWDEDHVKEHFKSFGVIERVVLARNMSTAKRKDFGFVNFTSHEAAVACVEGVNDTDLNDGKSKIKVRARLANPLPKTEAVKGGMSGGFRIGHTGIGVYSRFGRGFGRGRFPSNRPGFQGGRGFYPRGHGRAGGFSYGTHDMEISYPEFRGWRPYGVRGGRRGSTSGRLGAFDRGRGRGFPSRRPPFPPEGDFGGRFGSQPFGEDPYFFGDAGRGFKRPFAMMEHDPSYLAPSSRLRPRYDHPDPMPGTSRHRDSIEMSSLYSRDYYGPDYGGSSYSSFYGGEPSRGGYYY